jgi:hypothetical protein
MIRQTEPSTAGELFDFSGLKAEILDHCGDLNVG